MSASVSKAVILLAIISTACTSMPKAPEASRKLAGSASEPKCDGLIPGDVRSEYLQKALAFKPMTAADIQACNIFEVEPEAGTAPGFRHDEEVKCNFVSQAEERMSGGTPKFKCEFGGNVYKVKYQLTPQNNDEVFSEVAATRLLSCIGGYADTMYPVRVMAQNAPADPWLSETPRLSEAPFPRAAIEVKKSGKVLENAHDSGWNFNEDLPKMQDRTQADALLLFAAMVQHSDSRKSNQRLICEKSELSCTTDGKPACNRPIVMIQDWGHTFGTSRVKAKNSGRFSLQDWKDTPVWKDESKCQAFVQGLARSTIFGKKQMKTRTLRSPVISEAGRRFLVERLDALTRQQRVDLFRATRVSLHDPNTTPEQWADALTEKIEKLKHGESKDPSRGFQCPR